MAHDSHFVQKFILLILVGWRSGVSAKRRRSKSPESQNCGALPRRRYGAGTKGIDHQFFGTKKDAHTSYKYELLASGGRFQQVFPLQALAPAFQEERTARKSPTVHPDSGAPLKNQAFGRLQEFNEPAHPDPRLGCLGISRRCHRSDEPVRVGSECFGQTGLTDGVAGLIGQFVEQREHLVAGESFVSQEGPGELLGVFFL